MPMPILSPSPESFFDELGFELELVDCGAVDELVEAVKGSAIELAVGVGMCEVGSRLDVVPGTGGFGVAMRRD